MAKSEQLGCAPQVHVDTVGTERQEIELITQKYGNKTFEFINAQPLATDKNERAQVFYGVELEGRFTDLPVLASGTVDRSFIQLTLAVPDQLAVRVGVFEAKVKKKTALKGEWSSCVHDKGGQKAVKVRLDVTSNKPTNFRVNGSALSSGWPALKQLLDEHGRMRDARARVVLAPQKVWKVQTNVGITWKLLQIDLEPCETTAHDFFAE